MRVESIIGAAGFAIMVAIMVASAVMVVSAVIPEPLGIAIGVGGPAAVLFAMYMRSIWRGPLAALTLVALIILATAVMAGIHFGPLAALGWLAMVAGMFAGMYAFLFCLVKIYETNDPRFQIMAPILLFGVLALGMWQGLWQGFRLWFPAVFGFLILVMFCQYLWRLLNWKRAK